MSRTKMLIGRRQVMVAAGAASTCALAPRAAVAVERAVEAVGSHDGRRSATIRGVVLERPVHHAPTLQELLAGYARVVPGVPPPPGFGAPRKGTPAVWVEDGRYSPARSKQAVVKAGKTADAFASGLEIRAEGGAIGGVYAKGLETEYVVANANIELSGDGQFGLGGPDSGAAPDDYATLILRNCTITTGGANRNATSAQHHGILKVYNSTLIAHGDPFTPTFDTNQKRQLEIDGNSRAHVTLSNSYCYFHYCTVVADGWGALSMDMSDGFNYLEANGCKVRTIKSGYGTYSDFGCHNHINSCDFDVASMAGVMSGEAYLGFQDTKAKCGSYFVLIHCIGMPYEVSTLRVKGGEIRCKKAGVLVKSANVDIVFDGVDIASESGMLLQSAVAVDPMAAVAAHTKGQKVYGIQATLKNMDVRGDIDHSADRENRQMIITLQVTTLKGAVKDAVISMDRLSKWVATANSTVIIAGEVGLSQLDALPGVTITAGAGQSGTHRLASGGTLILTPTTWREAA